MLQRRAGNRATAGVVGRPPEQPRVPLPVQRALKFEFQTRNPVWRVLPGKPATTLGRKFGTVRENYLHKGSVGKPRTKGKEGTAVELQSELGGFVEFETASWSRKWSELAGWIAEAITMTNDISAAGVLVNPAGTPVTGPSGKPLHRFPFSTAHLRRRKGFTGGLRKGEKLYVELADSTWMASIQASESIELSEYESLLREHARTSTVTATVSTADRVLGAATKAGVLGKTELADLRGFVQIVVMYLYRGASQTSPSSDAKSRFR